MLRPRVWVALIVTLSACSSGGSGDDGGATGLSSEQAKLGFCADMCERFEGCALGDAASCQQNCASDWNPIGLRSEVLVQAGECTKSLACESFGEDDPSAACFDAVSDALPLSDAVLDYCEKISANDFRCNIWWPVEDCTKTVGIWRDEVLSDVKSTCLGVACPDLEDCYESVFDEYR